MSKSRDEVSRPRLVTKKITKSCPDCGYQLPTACKSCPCGHQFKKAAAAAAAEKAQEATGKVRRTERTKREKPTYYNSLEYEQHFPRRRRTVSDHGSTSEEPPPKKPVSVSVSSVPSPTRKPVRGALARARERQEREAKEGNGNGDKDKEKDEDQYSSLQPEKVLQVSIILAELNRKYASQNFKPS